MSVARIAAAGPAAAPSGEARLREACQDFEALFLALLFREMRATVPETGLISPGLGGDIFESLWMQEVGGAAARAGGMGLADLLVESLGPKAAPPGPAGLKSGPAVAENQSGRPGAPLRAAPKAMP